MRKLWRPSPILVGSRGWNDIADTTSRYCETDSSAAQLGSFDWITVIYLGRYRYFSDHDDTICPIIRTTSTANFSWYSAYSRRFGESGWDNMSYSLIIRGSSQFGQVTCRNSHLDRVPDVWYWTVLQQPPSTGASSDLKIWSAKLDNPVMREASGYIGANPVVSGREVHDDKTQLWSAGAWEKSNMDLAFVGWWDRKLGVGECENFFRTGVIPWHHKGGASWVGSGGTAHDYRGRFSIPEVSGMAEERPGPMVELPWKPREVVRYPYATNDLRRSRVSGDIPWMVTLPTPDGSVGEDEDERRHIAGVPLFESTAVAENIYTQTLLGVGH